MLGMRKTRAITAAALLGAATLGPFSLAAPASAAAAKIKCTAASGNLSLLIFFTGCSGHTGGQGFAQSSIFQPPTNAGRINWANGRETTVTLQFSVGESDPTEALSCPAGTLVEYEVTGTVTGDTTGSAPVGGVAKFELCVDPSANFNLEPGTAAKFK